MPMTEKWGSVREQLSPEKQCFAVGSSGQHSDEACQGCERRYAGKTKRYNANDVHSLVELLHRANTSVAAVQIFAAPSEASLQVLWPLP